MLELRLCISVALVNNCDAGDVDEISLVISHELNEPHIQSSPAEPRGSAWNYHCKLKGAPLARIMPRIEHGRTNISTKPTESTPRAPCKRIDIPITCPDSYFAKFLPLSTLIPDPSDGTVTLRTIPDVVQIVLSAPHKCLYLDAMDIMSRIGHAMHARVLLFDDRHLLDSTALILWLVVNGRYHDGEEGACTTLSTKLGAILCQRFLKYGEDDDRLMSRQLALAPQTLYRGRAKSGSGELIGDDDLGGDDCHGESKRTTGKDERNDGCELTGSNVADSSLEEGQGGDPSREPTINQRGCRENLAKPEQEFECQLSEDSTPTVTGSDPNTGGILQLYIKLSQNDVSDERMLLEISNRDFVDSATDDTMFSSRSSWIRSLSFRSLALDSALGSKHYPDTSSINIAPAHSTFTRRRAVVPIVFPVEEFINLLSPSAFPDANTSSDVIAVEVIFSAPPTYQHRNFNEVLAAICDQVITTGPLHENDSLFYETTSILLWLSIHVLCALLQDLTRLGLISEGETGPSEQKDDNPQDFESKIFWFLYRDGFGQHSGRRFKHYDSEDKANAEQARSLARRFREALHSITRHGEPNEEPLRLYITMDKVQDIENIEILLHLSDGEPVETPYRALPEGMRASEEIPWSHSFHLKQFTSIAPESDIEDLLAARFSRRVIIPIIYNDLYFTKYLPPRLSRTTDEEIVPPSIPKVVEIIITAPQTFMFHNVVSILSILGHHIIDLPRPEDYHAYDIAALAFWLAANAANDDEDVQACAQWNLFETLSTRFVESRFDEEDDLVPCLEAGISALKLCDAKNQSHLLRFIAAVLGHVEQFRCHQYLHSLEEAISRLRQIITTMFVTEISMLSALAEIFFYSSRHGYHQHQDIHLSISFGWQAATSSHPEGSDCTRTLWESLARLLEIDGSALLDGDSSGELMNIFCGSAELIKDEASEEDSMSFGRFLCVFGTRLLVRGFGHNNDNQLALGIAQDEEVAHPNDYRYGLSLCRRGASLLLGTRRGWDVNETMLIHSIAAIRQVLEVLPKDCAERADILEFLSMALAFERDNNSYDRQILSYVDGTQFTAEVAALHREVLALLPDQSPKRLKHLYDLAWQNSAADGADDLGTQHICEEFLSICEDVPSTKRCLISGLLANILLKKYLRTQDSPLFTQALTHVNESVKMLNLWPDWDTNLEQARSILKSCWNTLKSYQLHRNGVAVHHGLLRDLGRLVKGFSLLGGSASSAIDAEFTPIRHEGLRKGSNWSADIQLTLKQAHGVHGASAYAIKLCDKNRLSKAIEVVEEVRSQFWAHALFLRRPFDDLPASIRGSLEQLSRSINDYRHGGSVHALGSRVSTEALTFAASVRQKGAWFAAYLQSVRKTVPGKEKFGLPQKMDSLVVAAHHGPVVILLSSCASKTSESCYAICLQETGALRIPLQELTPQILEVLTCCVSESGIWSCNRVVKNRDEIVDFRCLVDTVSEIDATCKNRAGRIARAIPEELRDKFRWYMTLDLMWHTIVKPILDCLNFRPSEARNRRRLWWYPTGRFAHLPIHAAGDYILPDGECCSDYVVSSYTPTLNTLIRARKTMPSLAREDAKALLAAVPQPYSGSMLGGTVREMKTIRKVVPESSIIPLPQADDTIAGSSAGASSQAVLDNLPHATIFHLACHGKQYQEDPLRSSFILRDRSLPLSELMRLNLPNAFLAFLSACETAQIDGDGERSQFVNLAATMLFVGFKSVVGTMWRMNDDDGSDVAETVYKQLFAGDRPSLDPDDVPYALDDAVRAMRARGLPPDRWASFIHLGI